jgi:hypothetical protein
MQQISLYEQLITQLVERNLDRTRFYVGERELSSNEASVWLSRFLSKIMEFAIAAVPTGDDQLKLQIELANQLLMWLKDKIQHCRVKKIIAIENKALNLRKCRALLFKVIDFIQYSVFVPASVRLKL